MVEDTTNKNNTVDTKPTKARLFASANIENIKLIDNLSLGKISIHNKYYTSS